MAASPYSFTRTAAPVPDESRRRAAARRPAVGLRGRGPIRVPPRVPPRILTRLPGAVIAYPVPYPYPPDTGAAGGADGPPSGEPGYAQLDQERIRWVQSALNQLLRLRLPLDGRLNIETRSALRSFQRRMNLPADGLLGPNTLQALSAEQQRAAGTGPNGNVQPEFSGEEGTLAGTAAQWFPNAYRWAQQWFNWPSGGSPAGSQPSAAPAQPGPAAATMPAGDAGAALRSRIAAVARQELQRWNGGARKENEPAMRPLLETYWRTGVGYLPSQANWWSAVPWSAAFISYVVRQAGAGSAFRYSAGHSYYTVAARNNRLANNSNPFKAYRTSETAPRVGDIVCKNRGAGVTYDSLREGVPTHCDIVVEVQPGRLITIGGNVSNSVKATVVNIDANGRITTPGYFAIIRVG